MEIYCNYLLHYMLLPQFHLILDVHLYLFLFHEDLLYVLLLYMNIHIYPCIGQVQHAGDADRADLSTHTARIFGF